MPKKILIDQTDLLFHVSPHLQKIAAKSKAVKRQFYPSPEENNISNSSFADPLAEDEHSPVKGLVYKYPGRVLILLTMTCAAYCRFCTRRRIVSDLKKGVITEDHIKEMKKFLLSHPEISEIIFSGGDPVTQPKLLKFALKTLGALKQIKIIRIHTRTPVANPILITDDLVAALAKVKQPLYISVHFEHPDEITKPTIQAITKLRKIGAIMLSQSVFLKGVNDSYEILFKLYSRLVEIGVRPYYIFDCDPTNGVQHFKVPIQQARTIMTQLKSTLSGIACPTFVIDAPQGFGKIPVPLDYWQADLNKFTDFQNLKHQAILK
jgi:lysine 2,3-aminomutase